MEASTRTSAPLPPIGQLESSALKHEDAELQAAQTMVNINPHSTPGHTPYSGPPSTYTYPTSTSNSSAPTSATTLKTSDSLRSSQTDYDIHPNSAPPKQSLPSIHEALGRHEDEQRTQRPRSPRYEYFRRHSSPNPGQIGRPPPPQSPVANQQYSNSKPSYGPAWHSPPSPRSYGPVGLATRPSPPRSNHEPWGSARNPTSTHPPSSHPHQAAQSPAQAPQYGPPTQSPNFATQSYIYSHPPTASYGPPQPQSYGPPYPTAAPSSHQAPRDGPWQADDPHQQTKSTYESRDHHNPLKRHFDAYDLDALLNEVHECSYNLMQFSETFRVRSHQTQRSGPISGSTPSIGDLHEAMKFNAKIQEALDYALQRVRADEAEQQERQAQRVAREAMEQRKIRMERHEDTSAGRKETTGEGGFANADTKKRRGRAAPPGRCHSCNRAETPEWRRGPDGARTLCNACGLHYAKHTRKHGPQKAGLAGSNLRPKSAGGQS